MRIVIADDDDNVRSSAEQYLRERNHEIIAARNGREALAVLDGADLLLLDLSMPEMDGHAVLRELAGKSDTPVIVISGVGQMDDAIAALKHGAWDYIVKPIEDLAILGKAVERANERQMLLKQAQQYQQQLEELVRQRTAELAEAKEQLERKAVALEEVLATFEARRAENAGAIINQIQAAMPLLARLQEQAPAVLQPLVANVEETLRSITQASEADPLTKVASSLTPAELRICRMLREGKSSKEIAAAEGIAADTVDTHRRNIRRKFGIRNEKVNLTTYLQSIGELR